MNWFLRGLRAGIRTERIVAGERLARGLSPGMPRATQFADANDALDVVSLCPTDALVAAGTTVNVLADRCVNCMRCAHHDPAQAWRDDAEWAHGTSLPAALGSAFRRSIHVRVVDAGDCGACLNELALMSGPSYNLHRFGIFITPTPRQADVLLVVGPVTAQMAQPLKAVYDAMPEPKRVVAVGACAASGGVFGPSIVSSGGAADVIPVNLVVPGCPPPPLAVVHALRAVCGQTTLDSEEALP